MRFGVSAKKVCTSTFGTMLALILLSGCGVPEGGARVGSRRQAVCVPPDGGGDLMCPCTLNSQCTGFDDDTRLIVCNVPTGMMVGTCTDCVTAGMRPEGCACSQTAECAAGLSCNGRTCQRLRARGEFCLFDSDCGSDMMGAMVCLPTKSWCGPLPNDYYCDFSSDCLSGTCDEGGQCTSGASGASCVGDSGCVPPLVCSLVTFQCVDKQADGAPCTRNEECINRCNSFSGLCSLGVEGEACTNMNPAGDCMMGLQCTDCGGGAFNCRPPGSACN